MYSAITGDREARAHDQSALCGCTDGFACDGGCEWSESDLCSACAWGSPV
jgi:hypothetical protein